MSKRAGMRYIPHPLGEQRRRSAKAAIKLILKLNAPEVLPAHIHDLLDTMLWKLTEADGKYNTRLRSVAAQLCKDPKQLVHEHVNPRQWTKAQLLNAPSNQEVDELLATTVGCVVTREEHKRLKLGTGVVGLARYRKAGISVMNLETKTLAI